MLSVDDIIQKIEESNTSFDVPANKKGKFGISALCSVFSHARKNELCMTSIYIPPYNYKTILNSKVYSLLVESGVFSFCEDIQKLNTKYNFSDAIGVFAVGFNEFFEGGELFHLGVLKNVHRS